MSSILSLLGGIISDAVGTLVQWLYGFLFKILMFIKDVFDICYVLVRKLAGIDTYYYNGQLMGTGAADSKTVTGDIIEVLLRSDIVRNLFITLLVLGIILLLIVTFIAIWKSEWDFGKDGNSKSKVINASLKALFNFIAVPVITFFGIFVGNALLRAIDDATAGGENVKMSDIVLTSIATNALRADHQGETLNYNLISSNNTVNSETGKAGIYQYFMNSKGEIVTEDILSAFKNNSTLKVKGVYYVDGESAGLDVLGVNQKLENGTLVFSFEDEQIVDVFFDVSKFNYVLGYLVLIIMLKTMLDITFGLVKRFFNLLFLFIISPPIVAMTPINDKALGEWRKQFISNAGMAFVTLGIYNIFMSIYPLFERIALYGSSDKMFGWIPLSTLNSFVSLLFVCVGLNVVNDISKTISGLFGVSDLHDQSTDKGKSLWGSKAFGTAGKALKPISGAVGAVGAGAKFANTAKYKGFKAAAGDAAKGLGNGLKAAANAGPLADMWKNANVKGATKGFKDTAKLRKDMKVGDTKKAVKASKNSAQKEMKENMSSLGIKSINEAKDLQVNGAGRAEYRAAQEKMAKSKEYMNKLDPKRRELLDKMTQEFADKNLTPEQMAWALKTREGIYGFYDKDPELKKQVDEDIEYYKNKYNVSTQEKSMADLKAKHGEEWNKVDKLLAANDDVNALKGASTSIVKDNNKVKQRKSRQEAAEKGKDAVTRRTAQNDAKNNSKKDIKYNDKL